MHTRSAEGLLMSMQGCEQRCSSHSDTPKEPNTSTIPFLAKCNICSLGGSDKSHLKTKNSNLQININKGMLWKLCSLISCWHIHTKGCMRLILWATCCKDIWVCGASSIEKLRCRNGYIHLGELHISWCSESALRCCFIAAIFGLQDIMPLYGLYHYIEWTEVHQ